MNEDGKKSVIIGTVIVVLGLVFLLALVGALNSMSVYNTLLPIILIIMGISLVSGKDNADRRASLGLGMLAVGLVSLLIRFNIVSSKIVDGLLGLILVVTGVIIIAKVGDKHSSDSSK